MSKSWIPEIMYEDTQEEGTTSHLPFIPVPDNEKMPKILFIFESRETGDFEPGPSGEELPVIEMELHQYADMSILKEGLSEDLYDKVREVLSLEPLKSAVTKGTNITNNIKKNLGI